MHQVNIKSIGLFTCGISLLLFFHFAPIGFSNGDTMDSKNAKKTTIKENKMNSMKIGQESLKSKVRQKKAKVIITAR